MDPAVAEHGSEGGEEGMDRLTMFRMKGLMHSTGSYERTVKMRVPLKIQDVETPNLRLQDRVLKGLPDLPPFEQTVKDILQDVEKKVDLEASYWSDGHFLLPQRREFYEHLYNERYQYSDEEKNQNSDKKAPPKYPLHLKDDRGYNIMVVKVNCCSKKEKKLNKGRFVQSAVKLYKPAFLNSTPSSRNRVKTTMLIAHSTLIEKIDSRSTSTSTDEYISRKKTMNKLGFEDDDYYFHFLRNKESAFRLIAESYYFTDRNGYITALRPEIDGEIERRARQSGVRICYRVGSAEKESKNFRLTSAQGGLFSFEYEQNRMYLVQTAHGENWHVLLDIPTDNLNDLPNNAFRNFTPDFVVSISPEIPQFKFQLREQLETSFGHQSACLLVRKNFPS